MSEKTKAELATEEKQKAIYEKAKENKVPSEKSKIAEDETTVSTIIKKTDRRMLDVLAAKEGLDFVPWLAKFLTEKAQSVEIVVK